MSLSVSLIEFVCPGCEYVNIVKWPQFALSDEMYRTIECPTCHRHWFVEIKFSEDKSKRKE